MRRGASGSREAVWWRSTPPLALRALLCEHGQIRVHASSIVADPEVFHSRLSRQERDFAAGFVALMHDHLSTSVLHKLPEKYRSLSDDRRMGALALHWMWMWTRWN